MHYAAQAAWIKLPRHGVKPRGRCSLILASPISQGNFPTAILLTRSTFPLSSWLAVSSSVPESHSFRLPSPPSFLTVLRSPSVCFILSAFSFLSAPLARFLFVFHGPLTSYCPSLLFPFFSCLLPAFGCLVLILSTWPPDQASSCSI